MNKRFAYSCDVCVLRVSGCVKRRSRLNVVLSRQSLKFVISFTNGAVDG